MSWTYWKAGVEYAWGDADTLPSGVELRVEFVKQFVEALNERWRGALMVPVDIRIVAREDAEWAYTWPMGMPGEGDIQRASWWNEVFARAYDLVVARKVWMGGYKELPESGQEIAELGGASEGDGWDTFIADGYGAMSRRVLKNGTGASGYHLERDAVIDGNMVEFVAGDNLQAMGRSALIGLRKILGEMRVAVGYMAPVNGIRFNIWRGDCVWDDDPDDPTDTETWANTGNYLRWYPWYYRFYWGSRWTGTNWHGVKYSAWYSLTYATSIPGGETFTVADDYNQGYEGIVGYYGYREPNIKVWRDWDGYGFSTKKIMIERARFTGTGSSVQTLNSLGTATHEPPPFHHDDGLTIHLSQLTGVSAYGLVFIKPRYTYE